MYVVDFICIGFVELRGTQSKRDGTVKVTLDNLLNSESPQNNKLRTQALKTPRVIIWIDTIFQTYKINVLVSESCLVNNFFQSSLTHAIFTLIVPLTAPWTPGG